MHPDKPFKILFVEDVQTDVELAKRMLKKEGLNFIYKVVETEEAFRNTLYEFDPDVIISDYSMPTFDGMSALKIARAMPEFYPFILLTGSINEETAVTCMKAGANDYIIKEHIARLPFAVVEAINKSLAIAEKERIETSLLESERKFRNIFYNHSAVKMIVDPENGSIVEANKAAAEFYGWSVEELESMNIMQLKNSSPEQVLESLNKVMSGEKTNCFFQHKQACGNTADVELFCSKVQFNNKDYLHVIVHDITEQNRLKEQLRQSQKLESIGRLAGGMAHDYNNILTVILNYSELALTRLKPGDAVYSYIGEIKSAAERSNRITSQLLTFARSQSYNPQTLDLNGAIEDMLNMLTSLIGESIELEWKPAENLWLTKIDPTHVDQILANLCVNAKDAIDGDGKIKIETKNVSIDQDSFKSNSPIIPGDYIVLTISDNGCGMDEETQKNIFEPFFTTKEHGKGTGLGLSTIYGIVKQNDGFISVNSEPGKGTAFDIYLKRAYDVAETQNNNEKEDSIKMTKNKTILIVDDEAAITKAASEILENFGYNVLTASDTHDAIKIAEEYENDIDILITDMIMPKMNGKELADKISLIYPDIKILFISGYYSDVLGNQTDEYFLQKPFKMSELANKVGMILKN
ncbi:MAG: response regulator [Flexistipes sinusarabici]|uniref:histidine kinase n=1 Tax=Flexistipes sinusarabici TaxID=2352 RepID=A0A5D0MN58_FLESI|nr:response regulator [Flexistipes sinusarabici]TYB33832.1 MAG: response regulator [Flexistipes sinusarabici]